MRSFFQLSTLSTAGFCSAQKREFAAKRGYPGRSSGAGAGGGGAAAAGAGRSPKSPPVSREDEFVSASEGDEDDELAKQAAAEIAAAYKRHQELPESQRPVSLNAFLLTLARKSWHPFLSRV